jgi:hypothetical protein
MLKNPLQRVVVMKHYLIVLLVLLFSAFGIHAKNSELHLRVDTQLVQLILNDAVKHIQEQDGHIVRRLSNYNHELNFNLHSLNLDLELKEYAQNFSNIDLDGRGSVNILLESPQVRGQLFFHNPKFTKRSDGLFNAEVIANIRNFNLSFEHIWFAGKGIVDLENLSADSCHSLITSESTQEGANFILNSTMNREQLKNHLDNFYYKLNRESYQGHVGKLWARIDNFSVGWSRNSGFYKDDRNNLILNIKLLIDPKKDGEGIKLISFSHNLNRKGGAILPVYLPRQNIIIPPTFIRTKARKIVDDFVTDEEITRCTWVDPNPTRSLISSLSGLIARQISLQLTDQNVNKLVETANKALDQISIPEIPENLVMSNEDNRDLKGSFKVENQTFYIYQDVKFDFEKDLFGIIKNFTTYRTALGLEDLKTGPEGDFLEIAINSNLRIDGTNLTYHESLFERLPILAKDFKWSQDFGSNVSVAINGDFLNKIINPIKDHLLATHVPESISVYMNDNIFQVDRNGMIELTPFIEVSFKGYEVMRVSFTVKALPEVISTQDGKHWFRLKLMVPQADDIISNIKYGKIIKAADIASSIILWPFLPIKEFIIKPKIRLAMSSALQQYINNIKSNMKDIELTQFVKTYGVRPSSIRFHRLTKDNYMEIKLQVQKIYGLEKVMKDLK